MRVMIEAGADVDDRSSDSECRTPLYVAAEEGHANAVRGLLRAKANPLLG